MHLAVHSSGRSTCLTYRATGLPGYDALNTETDHTGHQIYNAFGVETSTTGFNSFIGFTGRMYEITIGLQYNLNRWYDPAVGRWVSEDPIGFGGDDTNLPGYVNNGPVDSTDPDGFRRRRPRLPCPVLPGVGALPVRPATPPAPTAPSAPPPSNSAGQEEAWEIADVDEYIDKFEALFNIDTSKLTPEMRTRFLRTAQRGCVGIVMLRLGYWVPVKQSGDDPDKFVIDPSSTQPYYPFDIEGTRFFTSYEAAAAQQRTVEATTRVPHAIVALQHQDLRPFVNLDPNRDRAPGEVFRDEIIEPDLVNGKFRGFDTMGA